MARTTEQIHAELVDIAPTWFSSRKFGSDFLDALADVLSRVETRIETLESLTFRITSAGEYLRTIARDYGVEPLLGETEASIRARATFDAKKVVETAIKANIDALTPEGFEVKLVEPYENTLDDGFFLDTTSATMVGEDSPPALGWVHFPIFDLVLLPAAERAYLDDAEAGLEEGAFLDHSVYMDSRPDDLTRWPYRQMFDLLDESVAFGVLWGATIADTIQTAHLGLFEDPDL